MIYTSVFLALFFIILFIIIIIFLGNSALRTMLDNVLSNKEGFENFNKELNITDMDECRKMDSEFENKVNFQTASNIPLTPIKNSFFVNDLFNKEDTNNYKLNNDLKTGKNCMQIPKLLYDGIWDPHIVSNDNNQTNNWELTNGNLSNDYYCSNDLLRVNKDIPDNFKDMSSTPCIKGGEYYTYYNDENDDKNDYQIKCFEDIFNAGIYPTNHDSGNKDPTINMSKKSKCKTIL